ncbi:NUDIX hydrolase [Natronoglomus mannanivorans]|uniref:NUDIX domain-containing protein n=1 Tax=Natronoglomus mannanivorans TaxID=2979990 RepID=A0AAP3E475_9EURY|nr:NUDIX domain-containing protein [Halobacteria archaeon AArc-xg1-1]
MDIDERTRSEIDRRLERLESEYGAFPVREERVTNEPAFFEQGVKLAGDGWIGDAGAWVTDAADRALLIRHEDGPERWGTPGGGHEPGETMAETARREVREETGLEPTLAGVCFARRKTIVHEDDPERRFQMLTVIFEADIDVDAGDVNEEVIEIGDDEILEARWFEADDPPEVVHGFLEERVEDWAETE